MAGPYPSPLPILNEADAERFFSRVSIGLPDECWPWIGCCFSGGYGRFYSHDKRLKASRVAFLLIYGADPYPSLVLHRCDNPPCCNPDHLFLGTPGDNVRDRDDKGKLVVRRGEDNNNAKLTHAQVIDIRERYAHGERGTPLAKEHNIKPTSLFKIIRGESWKHVGGPLCDTQPRGQKRVR